MKMRVKCSFEIDVEVPDGSDAGFVIEENGCPGTGVVGAAFDQHYKDCERRGVCWACALSGRNEIITSEPSCLEHPNDPLLDAVDGSGNAYLICSRCGKTVFSIKPTNGSK